MCGSATRTEHETKLSGRDVLLRDKTKTRDDTHSQSGSKITNSLPTVTAAYEIYWLGHPKQYSYSLYKTMILLYGFDGSTPYSSVCRIGMATPSRRIYTLRIIHFVY